MRKISVIILLSSLLCCQALSYGQEYEDKKTQGYEDNKNQTDTEEVTPETINKLRPGMELRKIGGINMIVPEGAKVYKQGPMLIMEEDGDYSARRFKEMDERFFKLEERHAQLEERQKKLEQELKELRKTIETSRK